MKRRTLIGLLVAIAVSAAVFGSAASLGGISSTPNLGADDSVVASCDTNGVGVSYTNTYDSAAPNGYKVTTVTVTGVADACDGQTLAVTVADSTNASVGSGTLTIPTSAATSHTVTITGANALAEAVTGVHVVISA